MIRHSYSFGLIFVLLTVSIIGCREASIQTGDDAFINLSKAVLQDKIKGAWAMQTIGVTYGGPTEFKYKKQIIPDDVEIKWSETMMKDFMTNRAGLYDDIYMDLTFVEVFEKEGLDAPASAHAKAYANAKYRLWHANQQGRYNILHGIMPPESGHWLNNPHAEDIDFQIEADFAGIMSPGMPNTALEICDKVGHIMNSGDGYYGGVLVAGMYAYAFIESDVPTVLNKALAMIPKESNFHQCISDVISWHKQYPDDWKKNWQLIEDKWGVDIGCPPGTGKDFNIDAKINSAYVVLGLLYGEGDIDKTLEISTRAGQDSDCNPATAGGILGTIMGYSKIPEYWGKGLGLIEDMDFAYTTMSLNTVYDLSYRHALELIESNGGLVNDSNVSIKRQVAEVAPLEQNFPGYSLAEIKPIGHRIEFGDVQELEVEFDGNGVTLTGNAGNVDFAGSARPPALLSDEQTLNGYVVVAEFYLDGKLSKTMELPLSFIKRSLELYFQYEIPDGKHTLKMKITNPHEKVYVQVGELLVLKKQ